MAVLKIYELYKNVAYVGDAYEGYNFGGPKRSYLFRGQPFIVPKFKYRGELVTLKHIALAKKVWLGYHLNIDYALELGMEEIEIKMPKYTDNDIRIYEKISKEYDKFFTKYYENWFEYRIKKESINKNGPLSIYQDFDKYMHSSIFGKELIYDNMIDISDNLQYNYPFRFATNIKDAWDILDNIVNTQYARELLDEVDKIFVKCRDDDRDILVFLYDTYNQNKPNYNIPEYDVYWDSIDQVYRNRRNNVRVRKVGFGMYEYI